MNHQSKHPEYVEDCFGCKLSTLHWGIVPGAYRDNNSTTMYDKDVLKSQGFDISEQEVKDARSDFRKTLADWES